MKKQTIFQCFLVLLTAGFCQIAVAQISVGVRGGISLNNLDQEPLEDGEPKPESAVSYQFAVPIEIAFGDLFAVQPEIMYATHGAKQEVTNTVTTLGLTNTSSYKADHSISALEIPVLAKVKFGTESLKFHVLVGPSFGFGLNGKSVVKSNYRIVDANGNVFTEGSSDYDLKAKFVKDGYDAADVSIEEIPVAKTNFNLHAGAGLGFDLGGPTVFLDARYILGLSDLAPDSDGTTKDNETTTKSNRIAVSLGVMFPLN